MDDSQANYSNAAKKMMSAMGYKAGLGLGKLNQGRVAPVDTSQQRGRRGLGLKLKGLKPKQKLEWDQSHDGQRRGHIPSLMDIPTQCLMGMYGSYQQNHGLYQQNHGSYWQNHMQMVMSSQIQAASSVINRMTTNIVSQMNGQNHGMGYPVNNQNHGMRGPMNKQNHEMKGPVNDQSHEMRGLMNNTRIVGQQLQHNQNLNRPMQQHNQYPQRPMNSVRRQPVGQSASAYNYLESLSITLNKDNSLCSTITKDLDKSDLRNTSFSHALFKRGEKIVGTFYFSAPVLDGGVELDGKQQGKPDLINSKGSGRNVLSKLDGTVNNRKEQGGGGPENQDLRDIIPRGQVGQQKSKIVGAPAGKGITTRKGTEPAGAHPANSVKRSLTDTSYDDKIKVARSSGHCYAINILQNISNVPIKYFEKSIGTVDSPIYECNAVFNGQKYRGVSRENQLAKHAAAEATLQSILQNWNAGKSDGVDADVLKSLVDTVL